MAEKKNIREKAEEFKLKKDNTPRNANELKLLYTQLTNKEPFTKAKKLSAHFIKNYKLPKGQSLEILSNSPIISVKDLGIGFTFKDDRGLTQEEIEATIEELQKKDPDKKVSYIPYCKKCNP